MVNIEDEFKKIENLKILKFLIFIDYYYSEDIWTEKIKKIFKDNFDKIYKKNFTQNQAFKSKITIISNPPLETLYYLEGIKFFQPFFQIVKEGKELFNEYSDFYQDYCYPFTILNQYDLTLKQRRLFLFSV